jgi:hypothetical protein
VVYVHFENRGGLPGRQSLARDSYLSVRIDGRHLLVDDGGQTFRLAFLADDGWHVEAGRSGAAPVWPSARFSDTGNRAKDSTTPRARRRSRRSEQAVRVPEGPAGGGVATVPGRYSWRRGASQRHRSREALRTLAGPRA